MFVQHESNIYLFAKEGNYGFGYSQTIHSSNIGLRDFSINILTQKYRELWIIMKLNLNS